MISIRNCVWVLFLLVAIPVPIDCHADDWTRFRGPNGTGISDATTIPAQWTADDFRWKVKLPGIGYASPIVVGERIYCLCSDSDTAKRQVLCLHRDDGRVLWDREYDLQPHHLHIDNCYASSTPVADGEGVVMAWGAPDQLLIVALDVDGNELWRNNLGPYKSLYGLATSPIIVDDMVVMANDQMNPSVMRRFFPEGMTVSEPGKSFLLALDRKTGEVRWKIDRPTVITGYSTPCVRTNTKGDRELVFAATAHGLTGVDLKTGNINWQVNGLLSRTVICPVLVEDLVLASHGTALTGDQLVAVRPDPKNEAGEIVYSITKSIPLVPCVVYRNGFIFLVTDDGVASCRNAKTGDHVWRKRLGGSYYASPLCVNNQLFCFSRSGEVTVLSTTGKYKVLGKTELGEKCFATPAVADGVMYVRTETQLIAITNKTTAP